MATRLTLLALVVVFSAGCGGSGAVPVSGRFVYDDGQPAVELAGGTVVFDDGTVSATGPIDADGRFTLSFAGSDDGAKPGTYKVVVSLTEPEEGQHRPPRPIPPAYSDPENSPLSATVAAGPNDLTLTVPRAGRSR